MIDTINDLKNNRLKAGVALSEMTAEHLSKMKRSLGSLSGRSSLKGTEPLRFGLSDLRNADKKGKWWLVGASWKGRDIDEADQASLDHVGETGEDIDTKNDDFLIPLPSDLVQLARQNGMATPIRRAIFVTLISSADYMDAQKRLIKLNLTRAQELEIPRVMLHCVSKEQMFNPYYSLIAKEQCRTNKKIGKAFGFAALGLFTKLGASELAVDDNDAYIDTNAGDDVELNAVVQWAKFYAELILSGHISISIIKVGILINEDCSAIVDKSICRLLTYVTFQQKFRFS